MKNSKLCLIHVFCKILDSYPVFVKFWIVYLVSVYVNEKFCNKNVCLDLFSVVLIVLP